MLGLRKAEDCQKLLPLIGDLWEIGAGFQGPHTPLRTAGPEFWAEKLPLADSSAQNNSKCTEGAAGTLNQTLPFAAPRSTGRRDEQEGESNRFLGTCLQS